MNYRDWRQAMRTPLFYKIMWPTNSAVRFQTQFITVITIVGFIALVLIYRAADRGNELEKVVNYGLQSSPESLSMLRGKFNSTYPLTTPVRIHDGSLQFRLGMVTDLDHSSRSKFESNTWLSYFLTGYLIWTPASSTVAITWDKAGTTTLKTTYGHSGRGMELSELVTFDGRLLAFDDRSGIVFVIEKDRAYPWVLLSDGDGRTSKGFKSEWATVKDKHLYVGSMGKEWTTSSGEFVNTNPMWVKVVNQWGEITHVDWTEKYKALRQKLGIEFPGYMLHESGVWSDVHRRWFFLPRRMSKLNYDENEDERRGTNVLLIADEDFRDIKVVYVGEVLPTHGFSSFKFIPGTNDEVIVALKTSEVEGSTATYVMAFTIRGQILMGETKVGDFKYEGLEFI